MRKYDEDYKRAAVRKVRDGQAGGAGESERELGVSESALHKWRWASSRNGFG